VGDKGTTKAITTPPPADRDPPSTEAGFRGDISMQPLLSRIDDLGGKIAAVKAESGRALSEVKGKAAATISGFEQSQKANIESLKRDIVDFNFLLQLAHSRLAYMVRSLLDEWNTLPMSAKTKFTEPMNLLKDMETRIKQFYSERE